MIDFNESVKHLCLASINTRLIIHLTVKVWVQVSLTAEEWPLRVLVVGSFVTSYLPFRSTHFPNDSNSNRYSISAITHTVINLTLSYYAYRFRCCMVLQKSIRLWDLLKAYIEDQPSDTLSVILNGYFSIEMIFGRNRLDMC